MPWAGRIFPETPENELAHRVSGNPGFPGRALPLCALYKLYVWLCFMGGSVSTPLLGASVRSGLYACV